MKSKDRVTLSLNHEVPDKVPVDFGGTGQTGIHISCVEDLRNYYGQDKRPVKAVEPYHMLGLIEDDLKECIGIDTLAVDIGYTMFGFRNENWKEWETLKHCCGSIKSFIPSFIDSGFDILNPAQISAANMDVTELKNEFGDNIVFWGGCVDTQKTLPFGKPEDVRREVLKRCEIFSPRGGFVFSSIHDIQANTLVENIVAMFDALEEFNG